MLNSISVLNLSGSSLPSFSGIFDGEARKASMGRCNFSVGLSYTVICGTLWFAVLCGLLEQSDGLRLLKDKGFRLENSLWLEQLLNGGHEVAIGPYPMLNISGTYKGTWFMLNDNNSSARLPSFQKKSGDVLLELLSSLTEIHGVHYVQGQVVLQDGMLNKKVKYSQGLPMKMEGVFVWPFRQLRLIYSSPFDGDVNNAEEFLPSNPYHLLGRFYLQVLQESQTLSSQAKVKSGAFNNLGIACKIQLAAQISQSFSGYKDVSQDRRPYEMHGLIESSTAVDDEDCFPAIKLNATSVNIEVYYNKAINYTLMVTFISFLQVLLLIRQMEHSNTQSGAAKVSLLMVGQQAILDAYLCLLHLTAGILVESLFNAFATAAFFKFVIFSIFEMRYLLAIWKARRPVTSGEGWEAMRRELSILYSRFYGFLLGGILIMYELHSILRYVLFVFYSFWIPQIVESIVRDSRKPLHPHYIIGMTLTRLAIPLYTFGCPKNFMRIETSRTWCIGLATLMTVQAMILLVQHYFGARWFIPRKFLPEKYSYFRRVDHAALQTAMADEGAAVDCVICMAVVDVGQRSNECMVTPCDHVFHAGCLQRWMDIKMECPTCRRALPPI